MSAFKKRLERYDVLPFTAAPLDVHAPPPAIDGGAGAPAVISLLGRPVGLGHPMVGIAIVQGAQGGRLLAAVTGALYDLLHAPSQEVILERLTELAEAHQVLAAHLDLWARQVEALPKPAPAPELAVNPKAVH